MALVPFYARARLRAAGECLSTRKIGCKAEKLRWKSRPAVVLTNGKVELIALVSGGHVASFRFGERGPNLLFEAPWTSLDPHSYREPQHAAKYGAGGRYLSGFTGHALALGYYGPPSKGASSAGLAYNGEAASSAWHIRKLSGGASAKVVMDVKLPVSGLQVEREIELRAGESFARFRETVTNQRNAENFFQWVQCATFGEPLLTPRVSIVSIPGFRGQTSQNSYDGRDLLAKNQQFRWPVAASIHGGSCDLRQAFHQDGKGYQAAVLLDTTRENAFVAVFNPEMRIGVGYCFPRDTFPWVALWEENRARSANPWNGMTRARGIEFGTSPFPTGLAETIFDGPLFDTRTLTSLDAKASATVHYRLFAAEIPPAWEAIGDVREDGDQITVRGIHRSESVKI